MQPHRDNHAVGGPAVHIAHQHAKRHIEFEIFNVGIGVFRHRPVVKHQIHTGDHRDQIHQKGNATHTPGETQARGVFADFRGVQMEPDIARDHQDTVARCIFVAVAENGLPGL